MKLYTIQERKSILNTECNRVLDIIIREYKPEKVILFGSFAKEEIHEWSDIDMLIIKDTTLRSIERCVELSRLVKPKVGIDFFIYTPDEYKNLVSEKYSFLINIIKKGKVVYEKRSRRMVCYHSQQAVEKILKAILVEHQVEIPFTHNLLDLNNAVKKFNYEAPVSDEDYVFLNSVYRSRYPSDAGLLPTAEPREEDAKKALEIANTIIEWFNRK